MFDEPIKILLVDDNLADARLIKEMIAEQGSCHFTIEYAERISAAVKSAVKNRFDVVLLDLHLPDSQGLDTFLKLHDKAPWLPIVVLTGLSDETMAARAVKEGAQDYLVKGQVDGNMVIRAMRFAIERQRQAAVRGAGAARSEKPEGRAPRLIAASAGSKEVEEFIETVAKTSNTSVLVNGETGTGKGLVANAIHFRSGRGAGPFIELNCSAIPDTLLESEMFGYEKGAFTDAKQGKKGLFELADGGTVFLDEIGDMDIRIQPKLLKFLENRNFRKVGGTCDINVDIRVIAATNKDLNLLIKEKRFREDLYYRLNVMVITIPPLRERKDDIIPLAEYFIGSYCGSSGEAAKKLSPECRELFLDYVWPGNIRELKNVIERATILSKGEEIGPEHLPHDLRTNGKPSPLRSALTAEAPPADMTLEEVEKAHIKNVLKMAGGNKTIAARTLGISRITLRKKMKDYGIAEESTLRRQSSMSKPT